MKTVGLVVLSLFAIIGGFFAGLFVLSKIENPSSEFGTYEDLAASGLIERGWVSEYLPRSATGIEESHDIDTNRGWVSFNYNPEDTALARANCRLLHETKRGAKFLCPPFEQQTSILVLRTDGKGELTTHADEI
jgi:hypothetical protein